MSDEVQFKPVKCRAWKLSSGEFLVLLFMRTKDDKLELLSEQYVADEAGITAVINDVRATLDKTIASAGLKGRSYAEFSGAKKA